jgi:pimeloyl-ACP methyl ester carboxylesterase
LTYLRDIQIEATPDLHWQPCFDNFTCAKLEVPLDYEDDRAGSTYVSFMKWSSTHNSTTAQDILLNPGGPGGSGIAMLSENLPRLLSALGDANNFVGFDPRGVHNSGPDLSCFLDQRGLSKLYSELSTPLDAGDDRSYATIFARAAAFGDFCTRAFPENDSQAKYANTVATAHDMRLYTELLAKSKGEEIEGSQLWYYGTSYGSLLGMTYASIFPNRVGRIVVDGIVDAEDYYEGKWSANLPDADEAFRYFFQACYEAGEQGLCPFWADSPSAIEARFDAIVENLALEPIPLALEIPTIITIADLKMFMVGVPHTPMEIFPKFAHILVELEERTAYRLAAERGIGQKPSDCIAAPGATSDSGPKYFISCTDANGRFNLSTYDAWVEHANRLVEQSQYLGEAWASITAIQCRKLNIKAPQSQVFKGQFGAKKTSNPLLFVSTRLDPVTPLRAAKKMVKMFGGAALLIQNTVGHASISSRSSCTAGTVRNYFQNAALPEKGTICESLDVPFKSKIN